MTRILTEAPIWVWPLLALLTTIGLRARQDRQVPVVLFYALPLLGLLTLRSVAVLPAEGWIWGVFAALYGMGLGVGNHLQAGWILSRAGWLVRIKGEWLTLALMMVIFWANFAGGFVQAVRPEIFQNTGFHALFAALLGASAGIFAGRALRVWQTR